MERKNIVLKTYIPPPSQNFLDARFSSSKIADFADRDSILHKTKIIFF